MTNPHRMMMAVSSGDPSGELWTWGYNNRGRLGLGDTAHRSLAVQVGNLDTWESFGSSAGSTAGIQTNGTLWTWGGNAHGQLGLGDVINRSSPVQVGTLTNWAFISQQDFQDFIDQSFLAVKTDGTLWAWGNNKYGQLGLGDKINRSSPVQVGNLTNWATTTLSAHEDGAALKTDGTIWVWGRNIYGQIGNNGVVASSSPIQVGALTTWASVICGSNAVFGIDTSHRLFSWGRGYAGNTGHGDLVNRSSPVQVGSLTDWSVITTGVNFTGALKTDGTIWAWGTDIYGEKGLGNQVFVSSPQQIGALTTWAQISFGRSISTARKTDGTIWTWGQNFNGQLGLGATANRSSPVQVGTSLWSNLVALNQHVIAQPK